MKRFQWGIPSRSIWRGVLLSVALFLGILAGFFLAMSSLDQKTQAEQKKSLEQALMRNVVYCYATEGFYPPGMDYLKEHYGVSYDEDRYLVDYRVEGSNLMPSITVIEKQ